MLDNMDTMLFTYELGGGLGHLNRLISVARATNHSGRMVFALPYPTLGLGAVKRTFGDQAEVIQGVTWPAPADPTRAKQIPTHSLADVLALFGLGEPDQIGGAVDRWQRILEVVEPRVIVMDFAPALRLTVNNSVPTIVVGNGYSVPPAGMLLPPLRPWRDSVPAMSRAHEARILEKLNLNRARTNAAALDFVADLFQGMETFVCTIDDFDPYKAYRSPQAIIDPINLPNIESGPAIGERSGGIFAYIPSDHSSLRPLLDALNVVEEPTEIYFGGQSPRQDLTRPAPHVRIRQTPADFAATLPQMKLLVHHGGLATTYAGLIAGVPQLIVPLGLEHLITARAAERLGAARTISEREAKRERIASEIRFMLETPSLHMQTSAASTTLRRKMSKDPVRVIAGACQNFLRRVP